MGYAVYWDSTHNRWSGYGVPAYCDAPDCTTKIDHGLAWKCDDHTGWGLNEQSGDEYEVIEVGCELTLCEAHRYGAHDNWQPKPNHPDFIRHILIDHQVIS